jgi:hypothetical protein
MRIRFVAHRRFETLAGGAGAALAQPAENDLRRGASVVGDKRPLFAAGLEHPDSQEEREPCTFEAPPVEVAVAGAAGTPSRVVSLSPCSIQAGMCEAMTGDRPQTKRDDRSVNGA